MHSRWAQHARRTAPRLPHHRAPVYSLACSVPFAPLQPLLFPHTEDTRSHARVSTALGGLNTRRHVHHYALPLHPRDPFKSRRCIAWDPATPCTVPPRLRVPPCLVLGSGAWARLCSEGGRANVSTVRIAGAALIARPVLAQTPQIGGAREASALSLHTKMLPPSHFPNPARATSPARHSRWAYSTSSNHFAVPRTTSPVLLGAQRALRPGASAFPAHGQYPFGPMACVGHRCAALVLGRDSGRRVAERKRRP